MRSLILSAGGRRIWRSIKSGHGSRMLMSTSSSPWLMLPPGRDSSSGDMIHNFYSLAEKEHLSFGGGFALEDGTRFVGSSHGWLALFNARNNHLFLTNPLSGRRINLPPVDKLPDPELNLRNGRASVSKVILSCSPDDSDDEWRALMIFGLGNNLALCSAGCRDEWNPIGDLLQSDGHDHKQVGRNYEDFIYCRPAESFICSPYHNAFEHCTEYWFVGDGNMYPEETSIVRPNWGDEIPMEFVTEFGSSLYMPHLVFVEQMNQLFWLVRFVLERYPHPTFRFAVFRLDNDHRLVNKVRWVRPGESLDGLAMFVGINHSFAVAAADFPNIKPNSIYFTHSNWNFTSPDSVDGCGDIGIFDFETQTVSPCCIYPSPTHVEKIVHPPLWFTPTPH